MNPSIVLGFGSALIVTIVIAVVLIRELSSKNKK